MCHWLFFWPRSSLRPLSSSSVILGPTCAYFTIRQKRESKYPKMALHNAEHSPSSAIRCDETLSAFDSKRCSVPDLKANSKSTLVFLFSVPRAFDSTFRVSFDCSAVKIFFPLPLRHNHGCTWGGVGGVSWRPLTLVLKCCWSHFELTDNRK